MFQFLFSEPKVGFFSRGGHLSIIILVAALCQEDEKDKKNK